MTEAMSEVMPGALAVLTIVAMAASTYLSRVLGFLALRRRSLGPCALALLETVPGCVLVAVIAPAFVADAPADLLALAVTLLAAVRLPLLPTVLVGVVAAGGLRHAFA